MLRNKRGEWHDDGFNVFVVGVLLMVCGLFMLWWVPFSMKECKKVGHSTMYCVMDALR